MTRPLSNDLRRRVVTAVVDGGMSRRGAARRFGIAPSTAIKWVSACRRTGSYRPRAQSGARRSQRIETHAGRCLRWSMRPRDMTLAEIATHLEDEHGVRVSQSTVWRFFHRRCITFKINGRTPASSNGLTCSGTARPGAKPSPISSPRSTSSSMVRRTVAEGRVNRRTGLPPGWRDDRAGLCADSAAVRRFLTGTGRPRPSSAH